MLTGGSGDVNPQFFTMGLITLQTNDTPIINQYALPIPRLKTVSDKQLVMEMLQMKFIINEDIGPIAANTVAYYVALTTNPSITASTSIDTMKSDPRTLADWGFVIAGGAAITPAVTYMPTDKYIDMTDSAGHGILLATDSIYLYVTSQNTGNHNFAAGGKLLFRFKEVDLQDYIGIVQGQQ